MSKNMIKFVKAGVYKTAEQAQEIADVLLMSTAFTAEQYTEVVVAIQEFFNPVVETEETEEVPQE